MTGAKLVMIEKGAVAKADKSARATAPFFLSGSLSINLNIAAVAAFAY